MSDAIQISVVDYLKKKPPDSVKQTRAFRIRNDLIPVRFLFLND